MDLADFDAGAAGAPEALRGRGFWRRPNFLGREAAALLLETATATSTWRSSSEGYETAAPPPAAAEAYAAALRRLGLTVRPEPSLVRHGAGAYGAPPAAGVGCLLDLSGDWRSEDGGLLLIIEPEGSLHGWRPEAGALTLYVAGRAPLLTMVSPGAPEPRYALFAEAEAV